jgi:hypothetical protein
VCVQATGVCIAIVWVSLVETISSWPDLLRRLSTYHQLLFSAVPSLHYYKARILASSHLPLRLLSTISNVLTNKNYATVPERFLRTWSLIHVLQFSMRWWSQEVNHTRCWLRVKFHSVFNDTCPMTESGKDVDRSSKVM